MTCTTYVSIHYPTSYTNEYMSDTATPSVRKNSIASSYINSPPESGIGGISKNSKRSSFNKKHTANPAPNYEQFQESIKTLESKCFVRRIGDGHFGEVFEVQLPFGKQGENSRTVRAALKTSKYYSQKNNHNIYKEYDVWCKLQVKLQNRLQSKLEENCKTKNSSAHSFSIKNFGFQTRTLEKTMKTGYSSPNYESILENKLCVAKLIGLYYFNKPNMTGSLQKYLGIAMKLYKFDLPSYMCEINPVDQKHILKIARQMVQGVAQLHSVNVFHGDLSRRNFLVDFDGTIILTDFGLSHKMKRDISGKYEVDYRVVLQKSHKNSEKWLKMTYLLMTDFFRPKMP